MNEMKKVLIISYHFPPMNVVASKRTKAYADYLSKFNIHPTILTHKVNSKGEISQGVNQTIEKTSNADIIRIPVPNSIKSKLIKLIGSFSITNKFLILIKWVFGQLDGPNEDLNSYYQFKKHIFNSLELKEYDFVIGIYGPHFSLKLAYDIYQKFGTPYILDFRDLWATHVFTPSIKTNLTSRIHDFFVSYYWKKWIGNSFEYSITSQEWLNFLEKLTHKKGHVISNGFNDELLQISTPKQPHFAIGCMGTFYQRQDLNTFLVGLSSFIKTLDIDEQNLVQLECLGISKKYRPNIEQELQKLIPSSNLKFHPRANQKGVIHFCQSMQLLWHPAFPDSSGWFSAKIYDYLASKSEIVFCPSDKGIVEETLNQFSHITYHNTSAEVSKFLSKKFNDWKKGWASGLIEKESLQLKAFTRSTQAEKMSLLINNSSK